MKRKILVFLAAGFLVSICASTTLTQTEDHKTQLYFVEEAVVKPSMVAKFEAHIKEGVAHLSKYNFPYPYKSFITDDFHYYFVWQIETYAAIDKLFKAIGEWVARMGHENFKALVESGEGTLEYSKWSIIRYRPELSYAPENPRLKSKEKNFILYDIAYILPDKEKEADEIIKKIDSLLMSKNIPDEVIRFTGDIGTDMPVYISMMFGKNSIDFWTQNQKMRELLGEEVIEIHKKWLSLFRKFERKTGWFRPDLSYKPEEM